MSAELSPFDHKLQVLADDARRADSARNRLERSDRHVMDALGGSFLGTLVELLETKAPVTVLTRTGSAIRGTVSTLGTNVVVVRTNTQAHEVLIRAAAIEGLLESGAGHNRSATNLPDGPTFTDLLDPYAEAKERIALTTASGNNVMGRVDRVGQDQVVLQLDGRKDTMTVPVTVIDQVVRQR